MTQPAVVRAHEPLHPDATGAAIHLYLGDLGDDRLIAEAYAIPRPVRISPLPIGFGDGRGIPSERFRRRLDDGDRARALESAVVRGVRL